MTNENQELDAEIAQLENKLASLRAKRRCQTTALTWKKPSKADEFGDPFVISNEPELTLATLPDLAKSILDALPVQVFLKLARTDEVEGIISFDKANTRKYTHLDKGKARKYTYLNQSAREPMHWDEEAVLRRYDCEAFPDTESGFALYQKMQLQESDCLRDRVSRIRTVDWTPGPGGWRRNETIEIPILKADGTVIGFCAIGQDIIFRELPKQSQYFLKMFWHQYKNLSMSILSFIETARERIQAVRTNPDSALVCVEYISTRLTLIKTHLRIAEESSEIVYNGLIPTYDPMLCKGQVKEIAADVLRIYRDSPYSINFTLAEDAQQREIDQPQSIKTLLVMLTNNALKHSSHNGTERQFRLSCKVEGTGVVWEISNPCHELKDKLRYSSSGSPDISDTRTRGFDGLMIGAIIGHVFPHRNPEEMVEFPSELNNGWVIVKLHCEGGGTCK